MQNAVLLSMTGRDWHTKVTHKTEGGSYTDDYWMEFSDDHSLCIQSAFAEGGLTTTYNGSYDILGMTEDGLVLIWNAKEKGKKLGRPAIEFPDNWEKVYTSWKAGEITAKAAMEQTDTKRTSFYKLIQMYEQTA